MTLFTGGLGDENDLETLLEEYYLGGVGSLSKAQFYIYVTQTLIGDGFMVSGMSTGMSAVMIWVLSASPPVCCL